MIIKFSFKYGLLAGAAIFVYILLELVLGLHGKHLHIGQYTGYFRYFFLAAGIYVGLNDLRYEPLGTVVTYWSAAGKGLGISAVTAICMCLSERFTSIASIRNSCKPILIFPLRNCKPCGYTFYTTEKRCKF